MSHPIPDAALETHVGVLGKTGAGKSYTARGLVERLLTLQRHVVIVDPTGAWWGLRTGFEIPIFGGRKGDVEISDTAGAEVAAVIVEQRTSAIVDLSLMSGAGQQRFMRGFAHRLRSKEPGALYLVIDEADEFLPQNLSHDQTNAFGDLKWMVRRGRLNGFRVMMITQRPAEIAKAVLTQIETLVAHRLTAPQDRKAIEEWVKGHHDASEAREVLNSLASLGKGEAWVWCPDINLLQRSIMPPITTFDSGATPEAGRIAVEQPKLGRLDLAAIRAALVKVDEKSADGSKIVQPVELPELQRRVDLMTSDRDLWRTRALRQARLLALIKVMADPAVDVVATLKDWDWGTEMPDGEDAGSIKGGDDVDRNHGLEPTRKRAPVDRQDAGLNIRTGAASNLPPRKQRILDAIAWGATYLGYSSAPRGIVAWIADISPKSSSFTNDLGSLRTAGLIEYPAPGELMLVGEGLEIARWPENAPDREALRTAVSAKLAPRHVRIVDALWNGDCKRDALAEAVGISATSSSFTNDLGRLRTLGIIDYPSPGHVSLGKMFNV